MQIFYGWGFQERMVVKCENRWQSILCSIHVTDITKGWIRIVAELKRGFIFADFINLVLANKLKIQIPKFHITAV